MWCCWWWGMPRAGCPLRISLLLRRGQDQALLRSEAADFDRGLCGRAARRVQLEPGSSRELRQLGFHGPDALDAVVLGDSGGDTGRLRHDFDAQRRLPILQVLPRFLYAPA